MWNYTLPDNIDENFFSDKNWPEGHRYAGEPIILRDYQVDAINDYLSDPHSLQELATGSGKTVLTAALSSLVENCLDSSEAARTIVIVPNKGLVTQTEEDYQNLGLDVGVYFGDRKEYGKTHTICTWQSLEQIQKRYKNGQSHLSLESFTKGVAGLIVDEVHGAKANILKQLLTGSFKNIPIRWGLTGTVPKEDFDKAALLVCIGKLIGEMSAVQLQEEGILANCHVNIMQMLDIQQYSSYNSELTYLTTNDDRLDYMAAMIEDISKQGNTLVLVHRIKAGQGLLERLPEEQTVFIRGKTKIKERKNHYDDVSTENNKIILATYGVAAVGINVPRIFNMVLVEPGKSFIRVIQSIGRGLRKTQDKDFVNIYDICSSAKFSKRHLTARKKIYKNAEYPFKIQKIDWSKGILPKL